MHLNIDFATPCVCSAGLLSNQKWPSYSSLFLCPNTTPYVCNAGLLSNQHKMAMLDSQLMTLVFKYIFVTTLYTMPFFKVASEKTLLLPTIECFGWLQRHFRLVVLIR